MKQNKKKQQHLVPFMLTGEHGIFDEFTTAGWSNITDYPLNHKDFPLRSLPNKAVREESLKLGLVNGYRIGWNPTDEKIKECDPEKNFVIVDIFRPLVDYPRPEYQGKFKDFNEYLEFYWDRILREMQQHPDTMWGCSIGEVDSCHAWPTPAFRDKKEAYRYWKKAFFTASYNLGNNVVKWQIDYFKKRGIDWKKLNLMMHGSMMFSLHYFYEWGFPFVWLERPGQNGYQTGIAFARGAARQYGGKWGIDDAHHHPHRNQCIWYDEKGRRRNGYTESLMLRNWMVTYLSGAHFLHEQTSELSHWIYDRKGQFRLSPLGVYAKKFADFCLRKHPDCGEPYVPIALMLNYYHGYDPRFGIEMKNPIVWNGKLPFTKEDANITHHLNLFFPNHNLASGMCDKVFNHKVPWKSQWEWLDMVKNGHDMRPYEEHSLTTSPYGDSVDVILDNASSETLTNYKLIFLAGPQELKEEQTARLLKYVKQGGTLITSISQIPETMTDKIGVRDRGGDWDYDITTFIADGKTFGDMRYVYHQLEVKKGKILGYNHNIETLMWEIPFGKGKVILSGIEYSQDFAGTDLVPLCKHVFAKYLDQVLYAKADPPTLQLILNQGDGFILLGAFNNSRQRWKGIIKVNKANSSEKLKEAEDIWREKKIRVTDNGKEYLIEGVIQPYKFAIYKLTLETAMAKPCRARK